ncbi:MAG: hypothetical protein ACFE0Q_03200 [Anaerolineae bacterium]
MRQVCLTGYAVLVSLLFSVVFTAQILAFSGVYRPVLAVPLTVLVTLCAYVGYQRLGTAWVQTITPTEERSGWLPHLMLVVSASLAVLIFLQRMVLWPQSALGRNIPVDFLGYHSIKVLQLVREGSVWDLGIPYGQYPFGYESLIAFGMFFTHDLRVIGLAHALIFVLFWWTIALLLVRYSHISISLSLLLALMICFLPVIFPFVLSIGKNDVLLSLTVLMAVLHAPVGDERFHPLGLAYATMLSLAIKATGLYTLFYLWGLVMFNWAMRYRSGTWRAYLPLWQFVLVLALMFPGGLWIIRNYLILGTLFTSEIVSFFQTSIMANLDNPELYNSAQSSTLLFASVILLVLMAISAGHRRLRWQMAGTLIVIWLTFTVTPLSAFLTINNLNYLDVQWRFVVHGIVMLWVVALVVITPHLQALYVYVDAQPLLRGGAGIVLIVATLGILLMIGTDDLFAQDETRWQAILDPTLQTDSIYDQLRDYEPTTIYIENVSWLAVALQNPDLTITETRFPLGRADVAPQLTIEYIAFVPRVPFPDPIASFFEPDAWQIIFENETGRIYQRVSLTE